MKAVILAGGLGTRFSEETAMRPKPMIEIGGYPILWHIMKIYAAYGVTEFIICCGYKGYMIKEYFANYFLHRSDVTINLRDNSMEVHTQYSEPWKVTLVDTGAHTMTGGRLKRVAAFLDEDEDFCMTYGDGLSTVNVERLIGFHRSHGKLATLTATPPPGRFGALDIKQDASIISFEEKPRGDGGMINGGFFVLHPSILKSIEGDDTIFERGPLEDLATAAQLKAFVHDGFWQCMDTLRDKNYLEDLWETGSAPWKVW